jgi:hypothetical protein
MQSRMLSFDNFRNPKLVQGIISNNVIVTSFVCWIYYLLKIVREYALHGTTHNLILCMFYPLAIGFLSNFD